MELGEGGGSFLFFFSTCPTYRYAWYETRTESSDWVDPWMLNSTTGDENYLLPPRKSNSPPRPPPRAPYQPSKALLTHLPLCRAHRKKFVGGETSQDCKPLIESLSSKGCGTLLTYSVEANDVVDSKTPGDDGLERVHLEETMNAIREAAKLGGGGRLVGKGGEGSTVGGGVTIPHVWIAIKREFASHRTDVLLWTEPAGLGTSYGTLGRPYRPRTRVFSSDILHILPKG